MSNRSLGIPFSRMIERVQSQVREQSTEPEVRAKFAQVVNQVYQQDIPEYFEWDYLIRESSITVNASHTTGNIDVTNGSTSISEGNDPALWVAALNGRSMVINDQDEIYTFTFINATTATISPAYFGTTATNVGYTIFQDVYPLDTDYLSSSAQPNLYYDVSGGIQNIHWIDPEEWIYRYSTTGADFATYWREFPNLTALGDYQIQITPFPNISRLVKYHYHKIPDELQEFRTGTVNITANTVTATTSADFSANISAGQWFRVDGQNVWRRISAVVGDTLTLENAYPVAGVSAAYTVSDQLEMPKAAHNAVFYGACMLIGLEQGHNADRYAALYQDELDKIMSKRNRKRFGQRAIKRRVTRWRYR